MSFSAVAGADKYEIYLTWTGSGNPLSYYQTFTSNSGTLWTLIAGQSYDLAVKAICGTTTSPMSAVLVLP